MPEVQRKSKKRVIQVAGNPDYAQRISPNKQIANPVTGGFDWGQFPELKSGGKTFAAGPIRLRQGEHRGPERGFGLVHIWEARKFKSELLNTPESAIHVIANLVLSILQPGAEIYYEGDIARAGDRVTVFKHRNGIVIVEEREDGKGKPVYSIVTAIPANNVKGKLIGNLV
jgi:hypothetical protein